MEDIVKEYIDYTKQKSNIEEVENKKLGIFSRLCNYLENREGAVHEK